MGSLTRVLATLLVLCSGCQAVKYRAFRVGANTQVTLPCWELFDANELLIWITPSQKIIGPDSWFDSGKYAVEPETGSLIVSDTVKSDTGNYKCITKPAVGNYTTTEAELEVIDVSYLPELDDWQANLTRGLIAAASTAVFFIAACGFKHFNWAERHPKRKNSSISRRSHQSSATSSDPSTLVELKGSDNPALSVDTDEIDSGL